MKVRLRVPINVVTKTAGVSKGVSLFRRAVSARRAVDTAPSLAEQWAAARVAAQNVGKARTTPTVVWGGQFGSEAPTGMAAKRAARKLLKQMSEPAEVAFNARSRAALAAARQRKAAADALAKVDARNAVELNYVKSHLPKVTGTTPRSLGDRIKDALGLRKNQVKTR